MTLTRKQKTHAALGAIGILLLLWAISPWSKERPGPTPSAGDEQPRAGTNARSKVAQRQPSEASRREREQLLSDLKRELREAERKRVVTSDRAEFPVQLSDRARQAYKLPATQRTGINVVDYIAIEAPSAEELAATRQKIRAAFASPAFEGDLEKEAMEKELLEQHAAFPKKFRILTATQFAFARNKQDKMIGALETDQLMEQEAETGGMHLKPVEPWEEAEDLAPKKNLRARYAYLFGAKED